MKIGRLTITLRSPIVFSLEPTWMQLVKQELREGRILMAVKLYKENTGKGLKECKDYVFDVLKPKYFVKSKEISPEDYPNSCLGDTYISPEISRHVGSPKF